MDGQGRVWCRRASQVRRGAALVQIFSVFCMVSGAHAVHLSAPDGQVERAVAMLTNSRTVGEGERALLALSQDRDDHRRAGAAAALADYYRRGGNQARAAALAAPWSEMRTENLQPNRLEALLEHARCEAVAGHPLAAFRVLDYARDNTDGIAAVLVRIACADVVELAPDYDKAIAWLHEAVTLGDRWSTPPAASVGERPQVPDGAHRWPPVRAEIVSRLKSLAHKADVARWGEDFVLYRAAQTARKADHPLARDFTDTSRLYPGRGAGRVPIPDADDAVALARYDRLIAEAPDTVYAEAARLYRTFCLARLGRADEAVKALESFAAAVPMGLYRGEALLTLGDLYLQSQWAPAAAKPYYVQALAWCENAAAVKDGARLYAVPSKASVPTAPPKDWQTMNSNGIVSGAAFAPGAVVNRLSAPWYLDWLRAELRFRLGFLACLAGDWNDARMHWQAVASHDPQLARARRNRYFNTIDRLESAAANRYLLGRDEENAQIPPALKPAIWWADFLLMREAFESAESLYGRLYSSAAGRGDGQVAARAALGVILRCYGESGRLAPAPYNAMLARGRNVGETVLKQFPQAPASAYIAFMIAYSAPLGNEGRNAGAQAAMRRMITAYPRSRHVVEARFWEIFTGLDAKTLAARMPEIDRFRRDFPDSRWIRHLDSEVEFIRGRQGRQDSQRLSVK